MAVSWKSPLGKSRLPPAKKPRNRGPLKYRGPKSRLFLPLIQIIFDCFNNFIKRFRKRQYFSVSSGDCFPVEGLVSTPWNNLCIALTLFSSGTRLSRHCYNIPTNGAVYRSTLRRHLYSHADNAGKRENIYH